jgi:superoxide dismutase, Fe-Mn family
MAATTPRYTLPDLPFDHADLEPHLSARILEVHHGKHHQAYVDGANATIDALIEARETDDYSSIVGLERTLAFNVSGHVLHSMYWSNLNPDGGGQPEGELGSAIEEHFGGFDAFRSQFTNVVSTVQGSGWAALTWEPFGRRLVVEQIQDHHSNTIQAGVPILVMDAWEHAYYLQYENRRGDYATAMWNVIDWIDVSERLLAAMNVAAMPLE